MSLTYQHSKSESDQELIWCAPDASLEYRQLHAYGRFFLFLIRWGFPVTTGYKNAKDLIVEKLDEHKYALHEETERLSKTDPYGNVENDFYGEEVFDELLSSEIVDEFSEGFKEIK